MKRSLAVLAASLVVGVGASPVKALDVLAARSMIPREEPVRVFLPSPAPSGVVCNDRVPVKFYAASRTGEERTPAVVLLHALGELEDSMMRRMARFFQAQGIASAIMQLPYHMDRLPRGDFPLHHYVGGDMQHVVHSYAQGAADVRAVLDWLAQQPSVDAGRLGIVGVSLGAIIAHLAMGQDGRLLAGVAILGGGNLADTYRASLVPRFLNPFTVRRLTDSERELVRTVDPITYAPCNQPRRVLMIQAARDNLVPPSAARQLHAALGRPPIIWLDTNHYAPALAEDEILQASAIYLKWAWNASRAETVPSMPRLPHIQPPTVKFGFVLTRQRALLPYLAFQPVALGRKRDYTSLLFVDVGINSRAPYASAGVTLSPYLDAGVAFRPGRHRADPYFAVHLTL